MTTPGQPHRRSFFAWLTGGLAAVAAAAVGVPFVGYLIGPLRKKEAPWIKLGTAGKFPLNETRLVMFDQPKGMSQGWDGMVAHSGVFVRNQGGGQFMVLAMNCTHLGCPVTWFPQSGLFMCPCHGGVYYENGGRASGPPPRGLFACNWRIDNDELLVQAPHLPTLQDPLRPDDKG